MNEITLLREAGPEAPAFTPAARSAARAALLDEIGSVRDGRRHRLRRPRRKLALRVGLAATAAAAAWTAAVVIAAPEEAGPPPGSVRLVAFTPPSFPLSLDPVPAGLTPAFSGDADAGSFADYRAADGADGFTVGVAEDEPDQREEDDGYDIRSERDVTVHGAEAHEVSGRQIVCPGPGTDPQCAWQPFRTLTWEMRDDLWVTLSGEGGYTDADRLRAVANSLVDRPQPVTLGVGLAPAGWSTRFYKDGRILVLADDAHPEQTVSVHLPLPAEVVPPDQLRGRLMGPVGPMLTVTVHGRAAQLVRTDNGPRDRGWYLQAQFPDGTTFVVQAPEAFTQEQVVAFAEQVTHDR
jgi:hypothetical protein